MHNSVIYKWTAYLEKKLSFIRSAIFSGYENSYGETNLVWQSAILHGPQAAVTEA